MNSLDSWIDLGEIADLVNQLMPEKDEEPEGVSLLAEPPAADRARPTQISRETEERPKPLVPNVPPEWDMAQPGDVAPGAFPSFDELPTPELKPQPVIAPVSSNQASPQTEPKIELPFSDEDLERAAENLTLDPEAREKILGTLAEIREMGGEFLGPEKTEQHSPATAAPASQSQSPPELPKVENEPLANVADTHERALFLPQGTLSQRLKVYADWVRKITECDQLMISDPQGYPLLPAESEDDAPLVSSSLQLMSALGHARKKMDADAPNSGVYLPLGDERWLGVLDCESGSQRVCVSMVTKAPLSAAAADELTAGLKSTLEGAA
ncbi:MAG: hypothetical protein AAF585_26395 [Verrucomicrobiota bacterium]